MTPESGPDTAFAEARSGALVRRVRRSDGSRAVLKATSAAGAWEAGQREFTAYTQLLPHVDLATPRVHTSWADEDWLVLVLADEGDPADVTGLTATQWSQLGAGLARLHGYDAPAHRLWRRADPLGAAIEVPDSALLDRFWADDVPQWDAVRRAETAARSQEADVFVHGDLHLANVLVRSDREAPRLADWQMCGFGRRASDLAFIDARLAPHGSRAPQIFLESYSAAADLEVQRLSAQVRRETLLILLLQWPQFAGFNTDEAVRRVRARVAALLGASDAQERSLKRP